MPSAETKILHSQFSIRNSPATLSRKHLTPDPPQHIVARSGVFPISEPAVEAPRDARNWMKGVGER